MNILHETPVWFIEEKRRAGNPTCEGFLKWFIYIPQPLVIGWCSLETEKYFKFSVAVVWGASFEKPSRSYSIIKQRIETEVFSIY